MRDTKSLQTFTWTVCSNFASIGAILHHMVLEKDVELPSFVKKNKTYVRHLKMKYMRFQQYDVS